MGLDFPRAYKPWHSCSPQDCFTLPVHKFVPQVGLGEDLVSGWRVGRQAGEHKAGMHACMHAGRQAGSQAGGRAGNQTGDN